MADDEEIFGEALTLPPAERAAFLDRSCHRDRARRARIEALLAGHDGAGSFLERPAAGVRRAPPEIRAGETIDRYTLVRRLGEGGCGVVYLAEQHLPVRRRVALKVIKLGMDTRQVIARFEAERQALALMEHPDIARVLDAGTTAGGRPYFVMEYVDGTPIHRYCDEHRLALPERLELFARVCVALQHAHQKGIIHRDMKPSNVLVAPRDGTHAPKLIDFGIAKATQERLTEQTLLTAVDQFIGTPAYMSPEQAEHRDGDIDTRSDVYALGVLLYELLTGRLPFDPATLRAGGLEHLRHTIRQVDPPRPSARFAGLPGSEQAGEAERRRSTPAALLAAVADDLDWIVMRCLEKDRERRYGSAQALADDVRRHLRHEPVAARPPSVSYRCRRFVARHRVACASAATVALTLVAATGISVRQAYRATRAERLATAQRDAAARAGRAAATARADAQRRQEQAEDLLTFMLGNFRAELKNTRVGALDAVDNKALAYFASLEPRDLSDTVLARQAKALYQIGETRMDEARYDEAAQAFAAAYDRAAALAARHPQNGDMLFERAQAEYWRGFVAWRRGDFGHARQWLTQYRDSAVGLVAVEGDRLRAQHELAYGHHNLAVLAVSEGRLDDARQGFLAEREAVEHMRAAHPDDVTLQFSLADIASWLGSVAEADGRYADAAGQFSECAARLDELARRQPNVARWRLQLADALGLSGDLFVVMGRRDDAVSAYARARALRTALVAQDPDNRQWQYAAAHGALRELALSVGEPDTPDLSARRAEIRHRLETLAQAEPSSTGFALALAAAWRIEARARMAAAPAAAGEAIAHALQLAEPRATNAQADPRALAEFAADGVIAGRIAIAQQRPEEARPHWQRVLNVLGPRVAASHDWRLVAPAAEALLLLDRTAAAGPLVARLQQFGFHAPDPLAASLLDSAFVPKSSN